MALESSGIQDYGFDANPIGLQQGAAANLLQQGNQTSPILSPWQGIARMGQTLAGVLIARRMMDAQQGAWDKAGGLTQPLAIPSLGGIGGGTSGGAMPGGTADASGSMDSSEHEKFIRDYAAAKGLDPNFVAGLAGTEGLHAWSAKNPNAASSVDVDASGKPFSFGDFQLNINPGAMGSSALARGIDPRDPSQWKAADAYAIDQMAAGGLKPWRGDAAVKNWLASGHGFNAPTIAPQTAAGPPSPGALAASPPLPPQGGPQQPVQVASLGPVHVPEGNAGNAPTPAPGAGPQTGNAQAATPQLTAPSAAGLFTGGNLGPMFGVPGSGQQPPVQVAQGYGGGGVSGAAAINPQMQQQMADAISIMRNPYAAPQLKQLAMQRYQLLQQYSLPQYSIVPQKGTNNDLVMDMRTGRVVNVIPGGPMVREGGTTLDYGQGQTVGVPKVVETTDIMGQKGAGSINPATGQMLGGGATPPVPPMPGAGAPTGGPSGQTVPAPAPSAAGQPWRQPGPLAQPDYEKAIDQRMPAVMQQLTAQYNLSPQGQAFISGSARNLLLGKQPAFIAGRQTGDPKEQMAMQAATMVDPEFTSNRFDTLKQFNEGTGPATGGGAITQGNTAILHLAEAYQLNRALAAGTPGGGQQTNNPFTNLGGVENEAHNMWQKNTVAAYNQAIARGMDEVTKFYLGSEGTKDERVMALEHELHAASTPDERTAAIQKMADLVRDKVSVYQQNYHRGAGAHFPDYQIIGPEQYKALGEIGKFTPPEKTGQPEPRGPVRLNPANPDADYNKLNKGDEYIGPDGRHYRK